jgi:hypothetical protein
MSTDLVWWGFVAIAAAMLVAGVARRFAASGVLRNALSVALVVLALVGVFLLCFGAGFFIKEERAGAQKAVGSAELRREARTT